VIDIWSGRRDSNPRPQPWQQCQTHAKLSRQSGFFRCCPYRRYLLPNLSGCLASSARRSGHDLVQVRLLEYRVSLDHTHRRPNRRSDIAHGGCPHSSGTRPRNDAANHGYGIVRSGLPTCRAMGRCQWIAARLSGIRKRFAATIQEHDPCVRPIPCGPDRQQSGMDNRSHTYAAGLS
jgi:hypothetical protein